MRIVKKDGFTLIEVILVIVIIGLLLVASYPALMKWKPGMDLKSDVKDIVSAFQSGRLVAVKRNTCATIAFNPDSTAYPTKNWGYTLFVDNGGGANTCNGAQDAGEETIMSFNSTTEKNITLISVSDIGGNEAICFNSNGVTCGSQRGNIQLQNDKSRFYKISVISSGGMKTESSNDGTNWDH